MELCSLTLKDWLQQRNQKCSNQIGMYVFMVNPGIMYSPYLMADMQILKISHS